MAQMMGGIEFTHGALLSNKVIPWGMYYGHYDPLPLETLLSVE